MKPGLINRIEKVIAAAEAELELADGALTLGVLVVGEDDAESAKALALTEHLKLHPQDTGRPIAWSVFRIGLVAPPAADDGGGGVDRDGDGEVHYTAVDGLLTLTDTEGQPLEIGGRRFSHRLLAGDDESAVAEQLAREAHLGV
jgi:hypothetical protein